MLIKTTFTSAYAAYRREYFPSTSDTAIARWLNETNVNMGMASEGRIPKPETIKNMLNYGADTETPEKFKTKVDMALVMAIELKKFGKRYLRLEQANSTLGEFLAKAIDRGGFQIPEPAHGDMVYIKGLHDNYLNQNRETDYQHAHAEVEKPRFKDIIEKLVLDLHSGLSVNLATKLTTPKERIDEWRTGTDVPTPDELRIFLSSSHNSSIKLKVAHALTCETDKYHPHINSYDAAISAYVAKTKSPAQLSPELRSFYKEFKGRTDGISVS